MAGSGLCSASLKDGKVLMKMGLALVLVGHVNFLLGALVHGIVLRHIYLQFRVSTLLYAISNVIAIVAGLMGIISGITAIVLSKNKKVKTLMWVLLVFSFLTGLLGIASATGLAVFAIRTMVFKGMKILHTHCNILTKEVDSSSITFECPFDPTRLYGTIIVMLVPLVFMSVVESVFAFRCFSACTSFLYLCPCRRKPLQSRVRFQKNVETLTPTPAPEPDSEAEDGPSEQDDLLRGNSTAQQSDLV